MGKGSNLAVEYSMRIFFQVRGNAGFRFSSSVSLIYFLGHEPGINYYECDVPAKYSFAMCDLCGGCLAKGALESLLFFAITMEVCRIFRSEKNISKLIRKLNL